MKKISLILLGVFGLLFSSNVYADSEWKNPPFDSFFVTYSDYYDDDNLHNVVNFYKGQIWKSKPYYANPLVGDFAKYTDFAMFGYYSDGTIIPYYKTAQLYDIVDWSRSFQGYTDPDTGDFSSSLSVSNSRRIDFTQVSGYCDYTGTCTSAIGSYTFRVDFAVKFQFHDSNYNTISNDLTKKIFSGIWIETAQSNGITCFAEYDNPSYTINISCNGVVGKTFTWSLIFNNIKDSTVLSKSDYSIRANLFFSEATFVASGSGRLEDLIMDDSPNGDSFNDYYKKVEVQSDSYFSNFSDLNLNGLSQIVLSPLAFIRSLSSPYYDTQYSVSNKYSCLMDPLHKSISIFNHSICVPSGAIFWNRGRDILSYNKARLLDNFRNFWNVLFGGYIIYFLCMKLYKTSIRSFDPDSSDEVTTL